MLQFLIFLHSQLDISDTEAEEDPPDHAVPMPDPTPPDVEEDPDPPPAYSVDSLPTPIPNSSHALDSDARVIQPASSTAIPYDDGSIPYPTSFRPSPSDVASEENRPQFHDVMFFL